MTLLYLLGVANSAIGFLEALVFEHWVKGTFYLVVGLALLVIAEKARRIRA
jgi:hypothetical protein